MNMFARFDENPAMTLQDIKKTKRYGRTYGCTHGRTHARTKKKNVTDGRTHAQTDAHTHARTHTRTDNLKTVYPPQTKFAGGIILRSDYMGNVIHTHETIYTKQ